MVKGLVTYGLGGRLISPSLDRKEHRGPHAELFYFLFSIIFSLIGILRMRMCCVLVCLPHELEQ